MAAIAVASILVAKAAASQDERRTGVWTGRTLGELPVSASGYQVYLLGEMHGIAQNEVLFAQYLLKLNRASGVRDVAIEEDSVYQPEARDYTEGRRDTFPAGVCLRAGILEVVRRMNQDRPEGERIRIHLVDIDTTAGAIRQHLLSLQKRIKGALEVVVPEASQIAGEGLGALDAMRRLTADPVLLSELRTIRGSIEANRQGLEVSTGEPKGSPYLDAREEVIAGNIRDIVALEGAHGVLAFYGSDHISKTVRKDGGANRDSPFAPMALRLERAGLKVFSLMTFPLTGRWAWRGRSQEMMWTPDEGRLESGETLDKVANAAGAGALIYIDRSQQRVVLPSIDLTNCRTDGVLLFSDAEPLPDRCSGLN